MRERELVDALCHYIDDFPGASATRDRTRCLKAVQLLINMGFLLNPDKLRVALTKILEGLGFAYNTGRMTVALTARRWAKVSTVLEEAYEQRHNVALRLIAKVAGHLLPASLVFGLD